MRKRILSTLLVLYMVLGMLPVKAWTAESGTAPKDPAVTELTVTYSDGGTDKTISLFPAENNQPQIPLPADGQLTFQIGFANWDQLDKVYVTSTRDNSTKYLEADESGTAGHYIASGCFDPNDVSYIPGKISIEYTKKTDNIKIGDNVDWNTLQVALKNYCTTTVSNYSGETAQADVDISKLLDAEENVVINFAIDMFDETTGSDLNSWLGAYKDFENAKKYALEGGNYFLYMDYSNPKSYVMIIRDVSGNRYVKLILDDIGQTFSSMTEVAGKLSQVNLINSLAYDYFDIKSSAGSLKKEIASNSTLTVSQKLKLNTEVDAYETDRRAFVVLTTILPAVVAATSGTMAGPAIVFTALFGAINAASSTFWDYRIGMVQGCEPVDVNFVGGACGVPLTRDYLIDNDIMQSGQYYLPEGAIGVHIGSDNGPPADVTLCLHGQKVFAGIRVANGSTLHLCDCKYSENIDGSVTGRQVPTIDIGNESNLLFNGGVIGNLYSNGGNVVITCGTITDSITGSGCSKIIVEGGTIRGGISSKDGGEIIIKRGTILSTAHGYGVSLWTDSGDIKILDGQISCGVRTNNGTIRIDGGLIGQSDTTRIQHIFNEAGVLELCGGTILGSIYNGEDGVAYISGGEVICTRLDNDNTANHYKAFTNDGGDVTITGGVIKGIGKETSVSGTSCIENGAGGNITISGGTLQSSEGICIINNGEINITGGTFLSYYELISNNGGLVTIHGGQFQSKNSACINNSFGVATILSGHFQGNYGISDYRSKGSTLLIDTDSIIEINAAKAAFHSYSNAKIAVKAKVDYNGGVTYYPSADVTGIKMTIEEAAEIDYTQPYVCLVAESAIFTVTFDATGGTVTPAILSPNKNGKLTTLPTPTRGGYVFKGWYTAKTGGTLVTTSTVFKKDTTLYAHWTSVETFKITLNANGGTVSPAFLMVASGKAYLNDLPTPTRPGYKFDGWYTTKTGTTKITAATKATKARTIYVHWTEEAVETFKITLNANGGTVDPTFLMVESGKTYLNDLPTPTRPGYKFDGWYTTKTGTTKITAATKATKARTIYAHWTEEAVETFKITLNANGGTVSPSFLMVESGKTYLNDLPTPTRPGYKFDGWYTTKTGTTKITAATKATKSRTIYAHWTEDAVETFKITLNANGGTVDPAFLMVESGKTYLNDLPTPTRPGYKFDGWYTTKTGKTKITSTTKATKARTIYAHWTEEAVETFKITLNANGGTVDPAFLMVESGKTYLNDLPVPTRDGFKFDGWYTTKTGKTKITAATKATKARTIYAHWTEEAVETFKITLNANGGTVDPTFLMVESGKTYLNDLPTPTRPGYKFDGWYTTRTGKTKITATTKATKARTIYAHWESQAVNPLSDADEIAEDQAAIEMDEQEYSFTAAPEDNNTALELTE